MYKGLLIFYQECYLLFIINKKIQNLYLYVMKDCLDTSIFKSKQTNKKTHNPCVPDCPAAIFTGHLEDKVSCSVFRRPLS